MSARRSIVLDGEVYALVPCPRREIVRAWRGGGGSLSMLAAALVHPGARLVPIGDEPPPDGGVCEPRRPLPPGPCSGIALEPEPQDRDGP